MVSALWEKNSTSGYSPSAVDPFSTSIVSADSAFDICSTTGVFKNWLWPCEASSDSTEASRFVSPAQAECRNVWRAEGSSISKADRKMSRSFTNQALDSDVWRMPTQISMRRISPATPTIFYFSSKSLPIRAISRCSHARAKTQTRSAVRGEIPRNFADSSMDRPTK